MTVAQAAENTLWTANNTLFGNLGCMTNGKRKWLSLSWIQKKLLLLHGISGNLLLSRPTGLYFVNQSIFAQKIN